MWGRHIASVRAIYLLNLLTLQLEHGIARSHRIFRVLQESHWEKRQIANNTFAASTYRALRIRPIHIHFLTHTGQPDELIARRAKVCGCDWLMRVMNTSGRRLPEPESTAPSGQSPGNLDPPEARAPKRV